MTDSALEMPWLSVPCEGTVGVPPPQPPPAPSVEEANESFALPELEVTASPAVYEGDRPRLSSLSFAQRLDASLELGRS